MTLVKRIIKNEDNPILKKQSKHILHSKKKTKKKEIKVFDQKPTSAFIGASWVALLSGVVSYCIGLWNANMLLNEKGYYFTVLLFALFSVISVQKAVRDKLEGIDVTDIYYSLSWSTSIISILLLFAVCIISFRPITCSIYFYHRAYR